MGNFPPMIAFSVVLTPRYSSDERLDPLTSSLRSELRELGVEASRPALPVTPGSGAKGDPLTVGTLVLALAPVMLPKLAEYLKDWCARARSTVSIVTLRAEVNGQVLELAYPSGAPPSKDTVLAYLDALSKVTDGR